jgi:hypothetical protein
MYPCTNNAHFTYDNIKKCLGEGMRPLARPKSRWEDNINMELQEVRSGGLDWIDLAHDRGNCECGNEPSGSIKCGEFPDKLSTG